MAGSPTMWAATVAFLLRVALAQRPAGTKAVEYPGHSESCKLALTTSVTCPSFLNEVASRKEFMGDEQLSELCVDECYASLKSARIAIEKACTAEEDVIVYDNRAHPATFIIDMYLFTYKTSCGMSLSTDSQCDGRYNVFMNSAPGGFLKYVRTSSNPNSTFPLDTLEKAYASCGQWHTITDGESCAEISAASGISVDEFFSLNPQVNEDCSNLDPHIYYCVRESPWIKSTDFPIFTNNSGSTYMAQHKPAAPGTIQGCHIYKSYNDDKFPSLHACSYVAYRWGVTFDQLLAWNPSLSSNTTACSLELGYSYCVVRTWSECSPFTFGTNCKPINATEPGTASDCNCFTQIEGYLRDDYDCEILEDEFSLTRSELIEWNFWLAGDCDTALYANMSDDDKRSVCIGVGPAEPIIPTQEGIASNCNMYYTVLAGDSCAHIESEYNITRAQIYGWNPAVGENCQDLRVAFDVCVGVSF